MKNAARILYKIGAIVGLVAGILFIISGIVFAILGALQVFQVQPGITAQDATLANALFVGLGAFFIVFGILYILSTAFAFKARNALLAGVKEKTPYVLAIVFGGITAEPLLIVPGIFSCIIANSLDEKTTVEEEKE